MTARLFHAEVEGHRMAVLAFNEHLLGTPRADSRRTGLGKLLARGDDAGGCAAALVFHRAAGSFSV